MYLYLKWRKLHKERKMDPRDAIMQTICKKSHFYLAGFIDFIILIIPASVYIYILVINQKFMDTNEYIFILIIILSAIGKIYFTGILNGQSIGYRLFGLRLVRIRDQKIIDKEIYYSLFFDSAYQGYRYNDTYETFSTLFSDTNQSPVMKKLGLIVVKKRLYNLFLEDYMEDGKIVSNVKSKTNTYFNNSSQIFFDE